MEGLLNIILFVSALAQDFPSNPHGCTEGSCYPATGNLLIGRASSLTATSTCGLHGSEQYCIVSHLQDQDKCFECNSQRPYSSHHRNSHRVENVIYHTDKHGDPTWWQSVNGKENVGIRLDLEAEFHFTHLIMKFKTFRPAAMLIERSVDFGRTWRPYRYFAYECSKTFPSISTHPLQFINDVICEERYSDIEPSTDGEVIYKVLDPALHIDDPYSIRTQELLRITNLRINFTKLHTLGDDQLDRRPEVLQKYYYSLYELVVRGSCFCYGHASECAPVPGVHGSEPGMIHGHCMCKHNTEGMNCERCKDFYHDLPWRPAESKHPHTCKECNCNGHTSQCHFDMAVYLATGNSSGGVCDNCLHNTMGRNCETCKPFYYKDTSRDIRDPAACVTCDCDPVGSVEGGVCDSHTDPELGMIAGQCRCKPNVRGARCDVCKEGHYGLSKNDPLGCQPCNCDPRGITTIGGPCDHVSGDCTCKRYVTGRYCNQCLPEYWGLSNDISGCRACGCDFGGAINNKCSVDSGQCDCRPHLIGRQCADVQPGYFCAPLDYYRYEAENAVPHGPDDSTLPGRPRPQAENDCVQHLNNQLKRHRRHRHIASAQQQRAALRRIRQLQQMPDVRPVHRERAPGQMITWTGPGFARVKDGSGLVFTIDNIPYSMEYDIMIRYEPESTEDWEAVTSVSSMELPSSPRCGNLLPTEQLYTVTMPHHRRHVLMSRPFCFEPGNHYVVAIRFQRHGVSHRHLTAFILVDSLVLLPKYEELRGFRGNSAVAEHRRDEMHRYTCVDSFLTTPMPALAEMCTKLICSISAIMHNGALPCHCDPQGSLSSECNHVGGQCQCKPNVIGRRCDQCAPGTYGFGPYGCNVCDCHSQGSLSHQCDPQTGQCPCRHGAMGRQCSDCHPGQWGFPSCRPCQCNGHSDSCDPQTGDCYQCRDNTAGQLCETCKNGYYGNPVLGSGEHCRPCPCPGNPGSGHSNGDSCYADYASNQILCNCRQGYTGDRCDRCAPGYYGDPRQPGSECRPCECNGNIDPQDPDACDPFSGQCLRCLYNTDGPSCSECKPGYYGNALSQDCKRCTCNIAGTRPEYCQDGVCHCDRQTGACPCKMNVIGHNCDECAPNHWNFGTDHGCEACSCYHPNALSTRCNMFSGQCPCHTGFGGKHCTECEPFHWGDPQVQCNECQCNTLGSESPQCDRVTGACICRNGASGRNCDECARGFTGTFPNCAECHACFQLWDDILCQVRTSFDRIRNIIGTILDKGVPPGVSDTRIRQLERKLSEIRELIRGGDHDAIHQHISQSIDDLRAEIAVTDGRLMGLNAEISVSVEQDRSLKQTLTSLEQELTSLNSTLTKLLQGLENHLTQGFSEQFKNILKYYKESQNSERRCNASTSGPHSPVKQSHNTRKKTEALLKERLDHIRRVVASQNKSLSDLKGKAHEVDRIVRNLSTMVCGGHGNGSVNGSCPDSPCGGAGCRDDKNLRVCGGDQCNGTMSITREVLQKVNNITNNLTAVSEGLLGIEKMLRDITALMQDVKNQSLDTLKKAQKKKDFFEKNNSELKSFIKKIKDFLTEEGADPESIETVAQQVLDITLPVNKTMMDEVLQEIRNNIANLTNIEGVYNHTSQHLHQAKNLLNRAQQAKIRAEAVKDATTKTIEALEASEKAIEKAMNSVEMALANLNLTKEATILVEHKLSSLEAKQMEAMNRLMNLSETVVMLRNKTGANKLMALDAKLDADSATQSAAELEKDMTAAEKEYKKLQKKISSLGGGATGNISQRAENVKKEAEDLLMKAMKDMERLKKLEKRFRNNDQRLQDQQAELAQMEQNVTDVKDIIRREAVQYSTCN
ncbi:laminin subunit beta-2 isoform X2 [Denticeps clupeoides]|uniref:laminin subunit beta-2 isoform X2 n=1 Tax=Denticeps clupeoides TaxID=299321 RepID=UPI0010A39061|nr:laminin subunit beta-2-like isoform X2 [Denticeps clupeoides]